MAFPDSFGPRDTKGELERTLREFLGTGDVSGDRIMSFEEKKKMALEMVYRCHTIRLSGGIGDLDLDINSEESATNEMAEGRTVAQRKKANVIDLVYMEDSDEDDSMYI